MIDHPTVIKILETEPNLGSGDASKCLPGWIKSLADDYDKNVEITFSHNSVGALLHTLVAARQRSERLVRERNNTMGGPYD